MKKKQKDIMLVLTLITLAPPLYRSIFLSKSRNFLLKSPQGRSVPAPRRAHPHLHRAHGGQLPLQFPGNLLGGRVVQKRQGEQPGGFDPKGRCAQNHPAGGLLLQMGPSFADDTSSLISSLESFLDK